MNLKIPLVLLCVGILISTVYSLPADCEQHGQKVSCKISLPQQLPQGTKEVVIQGQIGNTNGSWYTEQTFSDASWTTVTKLDITVQDHFGYVFLHNNIFRNLKSLQYLGYHDPTLRTVEKSAFDGLTNLNALDFSDCVYLEGESLINALNQSLSHIETLVINNIQNKFEKRFLLDKSFWNIIQEKKIITLGLSKINSQFFWEDLQDKKFMLNSVNLSSSPGLLFFFKNITIENILLLAQKSVFQHLKNIDLSYFFIGQQSSVNITDANITTFCDNYNASVVFPIFSWFEHLYMDGIGLQPQILDRTFVDLSSCKISLKVIHAASNHIQKLNATVKYPENMTVYEIDLSNNGMTYISPSALSSSLPLKNLYLSFNKLGEMQSAPEFPRLFTGLATLERLTLANNSFKQIPLHMFDKNSNLKLLDLSGNSLESITFETRHLIALEKLDLAGNKISVLDSNTIARLDQLLAKNTTSNNQSVNIILERNPYSCSCESIHSIKWLIQFQMMSQQNLYCILEGNTMRINAEALISAQNSCPKTKLIIVSTVSSISGLIVFAFVLFFIIKQKKKGQIKHAVERYVENYQQNNHQDKYVAMLSYSSQDDYNMVKYIYQTLDNHLKQILQVERDTVCIDYKHFRLGLPIVSEMMSTIERSAVMIFALSTSFCGQEWCIREFEEALAQHKPIILLFLEDIDENKMPFPIRKVYNRYTRAKLRDHGNEQYELEPNAAVICSSVLELASMNMIENSKCFCLNLT